jgi:hypothetical protein
LHFVCCVVLIQLLSRSLRQSFAYKVHRHSDVFDSGYVQLFASGYV